MRFKPLKLLANRRRPPRKRIFFEAKDWRVHPRYRRALQVHADHLRWNRAAMLLLTGHTSGRGDVGYNRNLGRLRASAVRDALVRLGAPRSRITVETLGRVREVKDVPALAVARRRRAEFHYLDLAVQSVGAVRPDRRPPKAKREPARPRPRPLRVAA